MAIQEIWTNTLWADNEGGGGYSQSATVNLPHSMPFAVAGGIDAFRVFQHPGLEPSLYHRLYRQRQSGAGN